MTNIKVNKTLLIFLLGVLAALGPFTIDMYLPGFKRIAEDFNTDENQVAFTLTSYFIGIAVGQLFYGPIVDKYGRKKPLLFGLAIYILAAFGCALSRSIEMMIVMRLLQALGGCVGMVVSNAIISDVYEKDKRAKAFSSIMLVMGVAPLIAPSVGSLILKNADWYYIFYFLTVFAILVWLMIYFLLPETSQYMHKNKLKAKQITSDYYTIMRNKTFLLYTLSGSICMSILFAYISSASFVFQTFYKLDQSTFSLIFAVNATGLILGSYLNGVMSKHFNYVKIAKKSALILNVITIVAVGCVLMFPFIHYTQMVVFLFSILFMIGFINPNATAASLVPFTGNTGAASALGGAIRMGVGAFVAAIIGVLQGNPIVIMMTVIVVLSILSSVLLLISPNDEALQEN